ncbi:hypothetical protein [Lignipirellula cremea]|uniref:Uncharacterized protein n=1 Tax=Lignipirellula cremea TaxID=2528010 RepID=A0A518DN35_9BACT|nr:hypothetical protein [Lignipirellula cremea]QDU93250.1 hypothetical protein Pla8534_10290 [Lignipirellula cremea]
MAADEPGRFSASSPRPLWTPKTPTTLDSTGSTGAVSPAFKTVPASPSDAAPQAGATLRWRPRLTDRAPAGLTSADSHVRQVVNNETTTLNGPQLPQAPNEMKAAPLAPADPFQDPFGDKTSSRRVAQNFDPAVERPNGFAPLNPPATAPGAPSGLPRFDSAPSAPLSPPARSSADDSNSSSQPRGPAGVDENFGSDENWGEKGVPKDPPCNNVYNERNCCKETDKCQETREALLYVPLSEISLNITPRYKPDAATRQEGDEARENQLAKTDARSWNRFGGGVIAHGRMVDYINGRVVVETSGGRTLLEYRDLANADRCFVDAWWELPPECSFNDSVYGGRNWMASTFTWKASALCHKPLYFEEIQLERYGHTAGPFWQPVISGAHFFVNVATIPYHMGINPPQECQYALGYYRPGSCAPWMINPIPLSLRGALFQAAAVGGAIAILP